MGKKVKEYKAGDFIFAKVKGYPAWPARVQKLNGKKYFVYFYGTGETANLPSNMIFDYAENKDKFLTKTQKRKLFNDGVKQIEYDFANNVPVEDVVGGLIEIPADTTGNETLNDTANSTLNDSAVGDSTLDETADESAVANTTQSDVPVEDSDENGALVIDEGKKGKKKTESTKTPAKETPKAAVKTPRGRAKKVESTEKLEQDNKEKQEEIVSRSGRKIRPKRFVDEQTEENSTLPSPVAKKRRAASPAPEKERDNSKLFNAVSQSELEDLKEPYVPADPEKQNILITYLPSGQYVGIKLFQSSPSAVTNFKNEGAKLSYDKQQAKHALTLKTQLERGQITPQSIAAQLVLDLNLSDEEKATLDKERETEEKKSRVQFLKTEMKVIELDAKIKTCLCLEKADTELCLKLLDELQELSLKPLMLLKHPACVETVKRMRAYVGNTASWGLSESEALEFSKRADAIRKQCDAIYNNMKDLFTVPDGLSFWEFFSERVLQFKKATSKLNADELLELVHEPLEMTAPTSHTMRAAIDAANEEQKMEEAVPETPTKKKTTAKKQKASAVEKEKANATPSKPDAAEKTNAKSKKETTDNAKPKKDADKPSTPTKPALKRQSSRNKPAEEKTVEPTPDPEPEPTETPTDKKEPEKMETDTENGDKEQPEPDAKKTKTNDKEEEPQSVVDTEPSNDTEAIQENNTETKEDSTKEAEAKTDEAQEVIEKNGKKEEEEKEDKVEKEEKEVKEDEPRAKRSRETKKTEPPPPRSPNKRKTKA